MRKKILAVCDSEQDYAYHFLDYLSRFETEESFPFEVQVFTEASALKEFGEQNEIAILLIAQSLHLMEENWKADHILVLAEEREGPCEEPWIEKYQSVETILRKVLEIAADYELLPPAVRGGGNAVKVIGVYSPVGRCLQTTFSFTLGQLLARKHKVLYLNFECFSGLGKMLRQEFQADLSDLIYFLHNGDGRFPYRLEGMTQKVNGLDYIPPAFSCLDLQRVEKEEWLALLDELGQSGLYEYVILDLSEVISGLFDILKLCFRVYTIVREDGFAAAKQAHYEELLTCLNHEDILENTRKCRLPIFRQPRRPGLSQTGPMRSPPLPRAAAPSPAPPPRRGKSPLPPGQLRCPRTFGCSQPRIPLHPRRPPHFRKLPHFHRPPPGWPRPEPSPPAAFLTSGC